MLPTGLRTFHFVSFLNVFSFLFFFFCFVSFLTILFSFFCVSFFLRFFSLLFSFFSFRFFSVSFRFFSFFFYVSQFTGTQVTRHVLHIIGFATNGVHVRQTKIVKSLRRRQHNQKKTTDLVLGPPTMPTAKSTHCAVTYKAAMTSTQAARSQPLSPLIISLHSYSPWTLAC